MLKAKPYFAATSDSILAAKKLRQRKFSLLLAALQCLCALYFFAAPAAATLWAIFDSKLASPEPASQAWYLHRSLSANIADWAEARNASQAAQTLSQDDISGTEWPAYGALFYLRATENIGTS
jgi:hypothetical protein